MACLPDESEPLGTSDTGLNAQLLEQANASKTISTASKQSIARAIAYADSKGGIPVVARARGALSFTLVHVRSGSIVIASTLQMRIPRIFSPFLQVRPEMECRVHLLGMHHQAARTSRTQKPKRHSIAIVQVTCSNTARTRLVSDSTYLPVQPPFLVGTWSWRLATSKYSHPRTRTD